MQAFLIYKTNQMEISTKIIIFLILASLTGVGLGIFFQRRKNIKQLEDANTEAKDILSQARREADRIKSEKMLQAKERFIELKSEHEKVIFQREKKISEVESRLREKENKLFLSAEDDEETITTAFVDPKGKVRTVTCALPGGARGLLRHVFIIQGFDSGRCEY